MGLLEDFGYDDEDSNDSYSPDEIVPAPLDAPTDVSALRRGGGQQGELRDAIIATATKLGIDPLHLATAISYETGGTLDPWKKGPTTQWGTHRGLIQWGEPQARQYGVGPDTSVSDQLAAVGKYLTDRGVKPGMGLLDVYSAINAGRVGLYDRSDAGNGGAPGSVRDKVNNQMGGHRLKAAALLGALEDEGSARAYASTSERSDLPRAITQGTNYVRPENFVPGNQGRVVPPAMRGPFARYGSGTATVGAPVTGSINLNFDKLDPSQDYPGLPQDTGDEIPAQLAALLQPTTPVAPILDESAGLNLAKTAPNISFASQDPITDPQGAPEIPSPVLPNLPPKDQTSLLVTKGNVFDPVPGGTPSPPISRDNMPAPSFMEAELPSAPSSAPKSFLEMLDPAIETTKQMGAKVVGHGTAVPTDLAAMASVLVDQGNNTGNVTQSLLNTSRDLKDAADFAFGVKKESPTVGGKLGAIAGESFTPMGKQTLAATALMGIGNLASGMITSAQAQEREEKAVAEKLLFPGIGTDNKTGPRVSHTVQTAAGPATVDQSTINLLGWAGVATIGAVIAPAVARKIASTLFGRTARTLSTAPGVELYSNRWDQVRMYDDRFAPAKRLAKDLGMNPQAMKEVEANLDFQTGSGTRNFANSVITDGKAMSPNFAMQISPEATLSRLAQIENDEVTQYMHLWHKFDEIKEAERILMTKPQSVIQAQVAAGHMKVRGQDKYQVMQEIRQMEATPEGQTYKDFRKWYNEDQTALRQLEATGEYSLISKQEYNRLQKTQRNQIHQTNLDVENTVVPIEGAAETMMSRMQLRIRERMENETKGYYIDQMTAVEPNFARKITAEEFAKNEKAYGPNVVSFYRRGKKEYWLTDPLVAGPMKLDPYYINGVAGNIIRGSKQIMEQTTTGKLSTFAPVNMIRNHMLQNLDTTPGMASANLFQTAVAPIQQLYPQYAKAVATRLELMSDGWLSSVIPKPVLDAVAMKATQVYDRSMFALLSQRGGTHAGNFVDYNNAASNSVADVLKNMPAGAGRTFLEAWKMHHDAVSNSPVFAYGARNVRRGQNPTQVANAMRDVVGNMSKFGQYGQRHGAPIKFGQDDPNIFQKGVDKVSHLYGATTDFGREASPWWNATTQGMKRVGKAYMDDPAKFVVKAYGATVLPSAALFMYNRGLGTDPNGRSYSDYQMNGRSGYNSMMQGYIGIPGKPVEEGIPFPMPHEIAGLVGMVNATLHHLTTTELFNRPDDFMRTALALVGKDYQPSNAVPLRSAEEDYKLTLTKMATNMLPATPPLLNTFVAATTGQSFPGGPFGGAYARKTNPFDDQIGMNNTLEQTARAIAPGLADIWGSGVAAFMHSEKDWDGFVAGLSAVGRRAAERTPIVGPAVGYRVPVSGATDTTDELWKTKKIVDSIVQYFDRYDPSNEGKTVKMGKSNEGAQVADMFTVPAPPTGLGLPRKQPANALYTAFIGELRDKFKTDTIRGRDGSPSGGRGIPSHFDRYSKFSQQINDMKNIDEGNMVSWQARIKANPDLELYLSQNDIDASNPRAVRNFLELQRQTVARQIMFTIKAVEQDFAQRLGDPKFKFEKLDPNQPYMMPVAPMAPYAPTLPSYAGQIQPNQRKK